MTFVMWESNKTLVSCGNLGETDRGRRPLTSDVTDQMTSAGRDYDVGAWLNINTSCGPVGSSRQTTWFAAGPQQPIDQQRIRRKPAIYIASRRNKRFSPRMYLESEFLDGLNLRTNPDVLRSLAPYRNIVIEPEFPWEWNIWSFKKTPPPGGELYWCVDLT